MTHHRKHRPNMRRQGGEVPPAAGGADSAWRRARSAGLTFRRGDLLAVGAVLLSAAGLTLWLWSASPEASRVQVYQAGVLVEELSLNRNAALEVAGRYVNTVTVRDGRAAVTHSDCPGADCVRSGWISSSGQSVVCLPNRVEVRLTGSPEVDAVAG